MIGHSVTVLGQDLVCVAAAVGAALACDVAGTHVPPGICVGCPVMYVLLSSTCATTAGSNIAIDPAPCDPFSCSPASRRQQPSSSGVLDQQAALLGPWQLLWSSSATNTAWESQDDIELGERGMLTVPAWHDAAAGCSGALVFFQALLVVFLGTWRRTWRQICPCVPYYWSRGYRDGEGLYTEPSSAGIATGRVVRFSFYRAHC